MGMSLGVTRQIAFCIELNFMACDSFVSVAIVNASSDFTSLFCYFFKQFSYCLLELELS